MSLELVVAREGAWDVISGILAQDAPLLQEGQRYRQVFTLSPDSVIGSLSTWAGVIRAEVDGVVAALRLSGVPEVSGGLQGNSVILNYRAGINPLTILGAIMAVAVTTLLFVIGYAIYRAVSLVPGVPTWVKLGLAALGVVVVGRWTRRYLTP